MTWLPLCLMLFIASVYMFSICPEDFFLARRRLALVICASAKTRSTKTCAISTSNTRPARCPTSTTRR